MEFVVAQLLNGLVYGMLLFLMAAGLSLIFGLMNVVSLAHGSFFMLGAFFGLSIFEFTGSFWLAFCLAPIPVVIIVDSDCRRQTLAGRMTHRSFASMIAGLSAASFMS